MLEFLADNIFSVVITVFFLAIIPWGRNVWLIADTLISLAFAFACILFPERHLRFQVDGVVDGVHVHMLRMFGLMVLGTSMFGGCALITKDNTAKTSILWGRVIGLSIYIMARTHSFIYLKTGTTWNQTALNFGIYGDCLWLLGNLIYAVSITDLGGAKTSHGSLNLFLGSDFVQTFLFAFLFFTFPGPMLGFQCKEKLRGLHLCIIRMFAAFIFNSAIISGRTPNFPSITDKVNFLTIRLIVNAFLVTAQLYTQLTTDYWTQWHIYFGMVGMSIWSINAAIGYSRAINAIKQTKTE
ncbi:uncharacterized protein LOC132546383 [Ylistrum balloti]|uniref:uncharacterized protein LOC132546383 n=1 Tax=Ylistrum balloti TaxID=509963 RepID=UPI0029059B47|nr:uncharacterized protein LOC132546383 [Ylistrum balloti]